MASADFEPSLSASAMRAPYSSAHALSMADSLPSIDFGFQGKLQPAMVKFQAIFDNYHEQQRARDMEARNQARIAIAEMKGWSSPREARC